MKNVLNKPRPLFKTEQTGSVSITNTKAKANPTSKPQSHFNCQLLKLYISQHDLNSFLTSFYSFFPRISIEYPGLLFITYQCWILLFKAKEMIKECEAVYSKYILPLSLQNDWQKLQLQKTKALYSCINDSNAIIKDKKQFNTIVDKYVNRVMLILEYIGETQYDVNTKSRVRYEVMSMKKLERDIISLFIIENNGYSNSNSTVLPKPSFDMSIFNQAQSESVFNLFSNIQPLMSNSGSYKQIGNTNTNSHNNTNHSTEISMTYSTTVATSTTPIKDDPYSTYNLINILSSPDNNSKMTKSKTETKIKYENPLLLYFNPKDLRKEEINKKLFRVFRVCVKEVMHQIPEFFNTLDKVFWTDFITKKLLPPMKYTDLDNRTIEFKSFSHSYFLWLFSKKGICKLYNAFINSQGERFLSFLSESPHMKILKDKEALSKVRNYIKHIPCIYSPSWVEDGEYIVSICSCVDYRFEFDKIIGDGCNGDVQCSENKCNQSTNTLKLKHPDFGDNAYKSLIDKDDDCYQKQIEESLIKDMCPNGIEVGNNGKATCCDIDVNRYKGIDNGSGDVNHQDYNGNIIMNNQHSSEDNDTFCSESKLCFKY